MYLHAIDDSYDAKYPTEEEGADKRENQIIFRLLFRGRWCNLREKKHDEKYERSQAIQTLIYPKDSEDMQLAMID